MLRRLLGDNFIDFFSFLRDSLILSDDSIACTPLPMNKSAAAELGSLLFIITDAVKHATVVDLHLARLANSAARNLFCDHLQQKVLSYNTVA